MQSFANKAGRQAGLWSGPSQAACSRQAPVKVCRSATTVAPVHVQPEDKWIAQTVKDVKPATSLAPMREKADSALKSLRMPTTRNEEYRYTDITPLLKANVQPAPAGAAVSAEFVAAHVFPEAAGSTVVLVDGVFRPELSQLGKLPKGVYVGGASGAPAEALAHMGAQANARGGPFAVLNAAMAQDALVVSLPANTHMEQPLYVLHLSSSGAAGSETTLSSAPRLLVSAGASSSLELIEEYVANDSSAAGSGAGPAGHYFTCSVAELFLAESAHVHHSYVQREAGPAFHFKGTLVQQAASSSYSLTEAAVGGALARHDLSVQQTGPATSTSMSHFLLCGSGQLHDLHSRLELNHPDGTAKQLHKCIVSAASGRGVFDGNVKVNRLAQKSDAGQLSRNLLLVPLATVNVKPNLQIIADDVKCTHGCAVSDLRDDELFYFRARGISAEAARQALVFSFGAEVVQGMKHKALVKRVQDDVARTLKAVEAFAS